MLLSIQQILTWSWSWSSNGLNRLFKFPYYLKSLEGTKLGGVQIIVQMFFPI